MLTPMHPVLFFLLLGIGLDDMFVIVQSWDSIEQERVRRKIDIELPPLDQRIGKALSHGGAAITITRLRWRYGHKSEFAHT